MFYQHSFSSITVFVILLAFEPGFDSLATAQKSERSLNGTWQFQREGEDGWKDIQVPNSFEEHEGVEFDGVGIYQKSLKPVSLTDDERVLIRFDGSATRTEVWLDGNRLGEHLGGWTPFQFDVTEVIRDRPEGPRILRVRVDEVVGHNSQGFLPIIAPHFGGIWQSVKLLKVPKSSWIDELAILAIGDPNSGNIKLQFPVRDSESDDSLRVLVRYRHLKAGTGWSQPRPFLATEVGETHSISVPVKDWKAWSPSSPNLYEVQLWLTRNTPTGIVPDNPATVRVGFRDIKVEGDRFLLNGKPLSIRGMLNWGYAPPRVAPSIDEEFFRKELETAKAYGFNLMKFCLWIPPKRYLEIADEMGMLTWVEYPTWHSQWTPDQLPKLQREYAEFFRFDRNHPSVILRSLTCETGPSADINVIRKLYELCHEMVPGSIVEDDSSWIQWNRVHDFYDDHPYGNNHTWVPTLERLKKYIADHGVKPLVLGESISADTWPDIPSLLEQVKETRPFWLPGFLDGNQEWLQEVGQCSGFMGADRLRKDSCLYSHLMRKYQVETYRREVPSGGYVVSVMRDFPLAGMGFVDYLGKEKWDRSSWSWHDKSMLLLETESDRRSFACGEEFQGKLMFSHFGAEPIVDGKLSVTIRSAEGETNEPILSRRLGRHSIESGQVKQLFELKTALPAVDRPTPLVLNIQLESDKGSFSNEWTIWLVPEPKRQLKPAIHHSLESTRQLFGLADNPADLSRPDASNQVVIARALDEALLEFMSNGGRVLLLSNGKPGSFPHADTWFLRGGPVVFDQNLTKKISQQMLVELQHFDLAGPVIPDIQFLKEVTPLMLLWDNHDLTYVKTHALVFETRVGKGRLLVNALNLDGDHNSAGRWILQNLIEHLADGPAPTNGLTESTLQGMREKFVEKKLELIRNDWAFQPDPENSGLAKGWHTIDLELDENWKPIKIGQAWESQGYPALDGWAWYRTQVEIPADWNKQTTYISFEGVDDHYQLYVNGKLAGSGGIIETKETAFEERKSIDVTQFLVPGETNHIAIQVYDWYGAGGLFRPITIGNTRVGEGASILK
jgi:hypothetical protein